MAAVGLAAGAVVRGAAAGSAADPTVDSATGSVADSATHKECTTERLYLG